MAPQIPCSLFTQTKTLNQITIRIRIRALEVVKQLAARAHHAQQATARVVILAVFLEVTGQVVDTGSQQCDLHFGRTGIALGALKISDDFCLVGSLNGHFYLAQTLWKSRAAPV